MSDGKTLTSEQHLQAFALFTIAVQHTREAAKFEKCLAAVLGVEHRLGDVGHLSDHIWGHADPVSASDFDKALRLAGFTIQPNADGAISSEPND